VGTVGTLCPEKAQQSGKVSDRKLMLTNKKKRIKGKIAHWLASPSVGGKFDKKKGLIKTTSKQKMIAKPKNETKEDEGFLVRGVKYTQSSDKGEAPCQNCLTGQGKEVFGCMRTFKTTQKDNKVGKGEKLHLLGKKDRGRRTKKQRARCGNRQGTKQVSKEGFSQKWTQTRVGN